MEDGRLRFVEETRDPGWVPGGRSFASAREERPVKLGNTVAKNVNREAVMLLINPDRTLGLPTLGPRLINNPAPKPVQNTSTGGM